jgi:DNA-directed RNA polymerase
MDAAALMITVRRALAAGVISFGMVHDSYGTHAADMDTLATCLREAFVELYQHDVLEEFRSSVLAMLPEELHSQVPPCPAKGDLDLNVVKQSVYFFA